MKMYSIETHGMGCITKRLMLVGLFASSPTLAGSETGQGIVVGAASARACFECHGVTGEGDRVSVFPRLAGQGVAYLRKQLEDYADGKRPNDIMSPIARRLNPEQKQAVAEYFSQQVAPYGPLVTPNLQIMQQGGALAAVGASQRNIPACVTCHGADGLGSPPLMPRLAGQHASYIQLQLELWQQDRRKNDTTQIMAPIAKRLTAPEIEAVAAYFAAWRPHANPQSPLSQD